MILFALILTGIQFATNVESSVPYAMVQQHLNPSLLPPVSQVVGAPIPTVTLRWNSVQPNVPQYEVWMSTDLLKWNIFAIANTNYLVIPQTNAWLHVTNTGYDEMGNLRTNVSTYMVGFFQVRALDVQGDYYDGINSDFAH